MTQSLREILEQYDLEAELKVLEVGIRQAATLANKAVYRHSRANPDVGNMGSTCVLAGVAQGKAVLGYAGDSRIYLLRSGKMRQLTSDHVRYQMVNEGEAQGMAAVVSRGMGLSSTLEVDLDTLDLEEGDTLLLCSDGVTDMVAEDDIARILATTLEAQATADALVALANLNGGRDNITALVVRYGDFKPLPPNTFAAPQNAPPPPRNGSTQAPPKSGGCAGKAAMLAVAMVFVTHTLWTLLRP